MAGEARSPSILIIEDDRETRDSMKCLLEAAGYRVRVAAGVDEALDALRGGMQPCLILLDLMMPGKTGFQFRYEQMQNPCWAGIPLVVYSGHHDIIANAAQLGAAAYFQKPVDIDALLNVVETYCRKPERVGETDPAPLQESAESGPKS